MPALFVFLFKVNIALLLFCAGYYLVLRHLTFYSLNRVYLVTAIVFATLYPNIDLTSFVQQHEELTKPVQTVAVYWQQPAQQLIKPLAHPDYWYWAGMVFWAGAALLGARLVVQLFSLFKLYHSSKPATVHHHDVRLIKGEAAPFSFWRSIYINPANYSPTDLEAILQHEQVHVNGWHTIDILLAEFSSIFYWFNPGVWLMKKAVRENIEFITDRKILNKGFDSKTYQYSLVNVSFNNTTPGIVNHFNISTIKKRIIMMNAKRSSKFKLTRYAFVVPAVVALLLVFTLSKANVTKPITSKITRAIKPVTAAIKHAAISITGADTVPAKAAAPEKIKVATQIKLEEDTSAGNGVIVVKTNKEIKISNADSANFVVNGVRVKPSEFKSINPEDITALNVTDAETARRLLDLSDKLAFNNNKVVFVTTKNSEAGKKLLEKLSANKRMVIVQDGKAKIINDANFTAYGKGTVNDVNVNANTNTYVVTGLNSNHNITTDSVMTIIKGTGAKKVDVASVQYIRRPDTYSKYNAQVYSLSSTNLNRISDKLIVIDGKEATEKELKKISAFDIDRMSVVSDSDTIKKYGDKAKYGVVYIYTKKGK